MDVMTAYENGDYAAVKEYIESCIEYRFEGAEEALRAYHKRDWEGVKDFLEVATMEDI